MDLIDKYNALLEKDLTLDSIPEVLTIQDEFLKNKDYNFYYLCTNKIIDIYINCEMLDDALELALDLYSKPNLSSFIDSYKEVIDQLIYIYITKQYYQRALALLNKKKDIIDINNSDEVNRLYLEFSYIHEALGEKSASLSKLKAILENNPTLETKTVALNNITKLYIDNNNFEEAKKTLLESLDLVNKINDEEGKRYCEYLNGLICHLQGNFKEAKKSLQKLYKSINKQTNLRENLTYLNEYFSLVLDLNDIREANEIGEIFLDNVLKCDDFYNKLLFLKNILRLGVMSPNTLKRISKGKYDTEVILKMVNDLENENSINNDMKTSEIKEDELSFQMSNSESVLYNKLNQSLNDVIIDYSNGNIRSLLINYSSSLRQKVLFDEVLFVVLNKESNMIVPDIDNTYDKVYTYQFKNERLYERELSFDDMLQTPVEKLLSGANEINTILDSDVSLLDPITKKPYAENYKYMYALSLVKNNKVFGMCIYLSKSIDFNNAFPKTMISIVTKTLSYALLGLYNQNCNTLQYNLLNTCDLNSNTGIFYYSVKEDLFILSNKCQKLLNINKSKISKEDYLKLINKNDLKEYIKQKELFEENKEYELRYHIMINGESKLISENANPLVLNNDLYYCGRISILEFDESYLHEIKQYHPLSFKEFSLYLDKLKDKHFKVLACKANYDLFSKLYNLFNDNIYLINDIYYYITLDLQVKAILNKVNSLKLENIAYMTIEYPEKLVRIDDLLGVCEYSLKSGSNGYIDFGNELYASYISKSTISECLERAIISNNITIGEKKLFACENEIGVYIYPIIKGIYNNEALKVVDDFDIYNLYRYFIKLINDENKIYLIKIRNSALYKLLSQDEITLNNVIFELTDSNYTNEIMVSINNKYKIIVNNEFMKNISLDVLTKYNKEIVGFSDNIDNNLLKLFKTYGNKYYMYDDNGFKIN